MNAYNQILYPGYTHPQTHPDRLATVGALFGMRVAPIGGCRVLELGCGTGSNLIPIASTLPASEFIGIDLASRPIAFGQQMIKELELRNVRLVEGNILQIETELGKFDYIVAHGVFSWVPAEVRDHLLRVCRTCLNPAGIAFISYNAYPGCHLRSMLREMMLFHIRGIDSPQQQIEQATALVRFLAESQELGDEYRRWMKAELETILERQDGHLYHDELAAENRPFYFSDFMSRAHGAGLQYLAEADFFEMSEHVFPPAVQERLGQLAQQRVLREQYLDFLKCRRFRQTLLCHREVSLAGQPLPQAVANLRISSAVTSQSIPADLRPGVTVVFQAPKGAKAETDFPLGKAALLVLSEAGPDGLHFADLIEHSRKRLSQAELPFHQGAEESDSLCSFLLRLYGAGVVEFRTRRPPGVRTASHRPAVTPVTRWQIQHGNWVSSLFHVAVQVEDEIGRQLLVLLDGTRDRVALADQLLLWLASKGNSDDSQDKRQSLRQNIEVELEKNLEKLARLGLLIA